MDNTRIASFDALVSIFTSDKLFIGVLRAEWIISAFAHCHGRNYLESFVSIQNGTLKFDDMRLLVQPVDQYLMIVAVILVFSSLGADSGRLLGIRQE